MLSNDFFNAIIKGRAGPLDILHLHVKLKEEKGEIFVSKSDVEKNAAVIQVVFFLHRNAFWIDVYWPSRERLYQIKGSGAVRWRAFES